MTDSDSSNIVNSPKVKALAEEIKAAVNHYFYASNDKIEAMAELQGAFEGTVMAIKQLRALHKLGIIDITADFNPGSFGSDDANSD